MSFYQKELRGFRKLHISSGVQYLFTIPFISNNLLGYDDSLEYLRKLNPDVGSSSFQKNTIHSAEVDLQVVVAAYNCEDSIEICVKSILNQSTKYSVRLVVVDDGSDDQTGIILDELASEFGNLVVIHQENKGFSGARNAGIKDIYGKYVSFVDSDDTLNDGAIDALLDGAFEKNVDILEGSYNVVSNGKVLGTTLHQDQEKINPFTDLFGYPWGKVYKAELFNDVIFPENYWLEDTVGMYRIWPKCTKVGTISNVVYNYEDNLLGITHSSVGKPKIIDTLWITLKLLDDYFKYEKENQQAVYDFTLQQIKMNTMRINTLHDEKANKANFVVSMKMLKQNFPTFNTKRKDLMYLEKSLRQGNYRKFQIANLGM